MECEYESADGSIVDRTVVFVGPGSPPCPAINGFSYLFAGGFFTTAGHLIDQLSDLARSRFEILCDEPQNLRPRMTGHARAQILWFIAENLEPRSGQIAQLIDEMTGCGEEAAREEVAETVDRWTWWASWADKHDGAVHDAPIRGLVLALHEPYGTAGLICPETKPLLGLVAFCAPLLAAGNAVIAIPSTACLAAVEMCRIIEHSDLLPGALNLLTGDAAEIGPVLAAHDDVDLLWYDSQGNLGAELETASAGNMKVCWCPGDPSVRSRELLDRSVQVKNIWLPHGI